MSNLDIYNAVRKPPIEAIKPIAAGRLKGKSDINPMWRIKALTEQFGPCGIGWKYSIVEKRLEPAPNGEVAAFVDINLFVKVAGEWSEPIPGTGGSSFVANEKNGPYVSDECFKMALTDALSVGCKALGFGADIYWEKDRSKYSEAPQGTQGQQGKRLDKISIDQAIVLRDLLNQGQQFTEKIFCAQAKIPRLEDLAADRYDGAFKHAQSQIAKEQVTA